MRAYSGTIVLMFGLCLLAACAAKGPPHNLERLGSIDPARAVRCPDHQVAYCAGTDCRPEDFYCVHRDQVFGAIWLNR